MVVPYLRTLIDVRGTQRQPVTGFALEGVGVTQTATTYFEDYEAVTSGDYSYHRGAAVFVEGAVAPRVHDCAFVRVDGNALFLSKYVRNASVTASEFAYTGDNGVTMIGTTAAGAKGVDGTDGEHPRWSTVSGNLLREIGVYQKQATPVWQSIACGSNISSNVIMNTPRAAINL